VSTVVQPSPPSRWWIRLPGPTSTPPAPTPAGAPGPDGEQMLVDGVGVARLLTFTGPCPAGHDARWTAERLDARSRTTYTCATCPPDDPGGAS